MTLATKLRKMGIEINQGGKEYADYSQKKLIFPKHNGNIHPDSKRSSNNLCTKKHTRGRVKYV